MGTEMEPVFAGTPQRGPAGDRQDRELRLACRATGSGGGLRPDRGRVGDRQVGGAAHRRRAVGDDVGCGGRRVAAAPVQGCRLPPPRRRYTWNWSRPTPRPLIWRSSPNRTASNNATSRSIGRERNGVSFQRTNPRHRGDAMPGIDFHRLRREITMEQVLDLLGFQPSHRTHHQWYGSCPLHDATAGRRRSFSVNVAIGRYYCHQCHSQGNQLELWAAAAKLPLHPATIGLCRALGLEVPWLRRW